MKHLPHTHTTLRSPLLLVSIDKSTVLNVKIKHILSYTLYQYFTYFVFNMKRSNVHLGPHDGGAGAATTPIAPPVACHCDAAAGSSDGGAGEVAIYRVVRPNSRDYWKARAIAAESSLKSSVEGCGIEYSDLLLTHSAEERKQRMALWEMALLRCDTLEWEGEMKEVYLESTSWGEVIDGATYNSYNPLRYAKYRSNMSLEAAEEWAADRHQHRGWGLSYLSEIALRIRNNHEVPFFQTVMSIDVCARCTPRAAWDNLRALRILPGHQWTQGAIEQLLVTFYNQSKGKLSGVQNAAYDNHEYHIKLTFQRVDANAEFLHTVNSVWFPCLQDDYPLDEDEYGELQQLVSIDTLTFIA